MIGRKTLQIILTFIPKICKLRINLRTAGQQTKQIVSNGTSQASKNSNTNSKSTQITLFQRTKNSSISRSLVSELQKSFDVSVSSRTVGFGFGTILTLLLGTAFAEDRRGRGALTPSLRNAAPPNPSPSKLNQLDPFGDIGPIVNPIGEVDVEQMMENIIKLHSAKNKEEQGTMMEIQTLLKEGKTLSALKKVQKLIDGNPTNPLYHVVLADVYKFRKDGNRAIEEYREALRLDPNLALVHFWLAEAMIPFLRAQEAIQHLDQVLALQKTGGLRTLALLLKAFATAHIGKANDALALSVEVAKANPPLKNKENIRLLYRIQIEILNNENRYKDFLQLLEFIRKQHPWMIDDQMYHGFRADALCALKDYQEAFKEYDTTIKIRRGDELSYIAKGTCQEQAKMIPEAIATYQQAARALPEPEGFLLRQAALLIKLKLYEKALEVLQPLDKGEETDEMVQLYKMQAERALRRQQMQQQPAANA